MKALTICQPYAALITLPDDHDRAKRVENRKWATNHRGPLLIHAGKSRDWLDLDESGTRDESYDLPLADMPFGAIVGVCELRGCVPVGPSIDLTRPATLHRRSIPDWALRRWPWLAGHEHVEGPICWILAECRRFERPIPWRGKQSLFDVPDDVVAEQLAK